MAHFITLFFLSIGLNFGTPQTQDFTAVQNNRQLDSFKLGKFTPKNNIRTIRKKLYTDNKNVLLINKGGVRNWGEE